MPRTVIWWNVQRLFAPTGSRLSRSLGATSAQGWTRAAYEQKLDHLAAVIAHVAGDEPPAILALAEVENAAVTSELLERLPWRGLEVAIDPEAQLAGDDLVVAYDSKILSLVGEPTSHLVHNRFATRDIFELELRIKGGGQFVLFTNHWPSRIVSNSLPLRIGAADYLRRLLDRRLKYEKGDLIDTKGKARMPSLDALVERAETPLILLGDFNDSPFDTSVSEGLGASRSHAPATGALRFPKGRDLAAIESYLQRKIKLFNPCWSLLVDPSSPGAPSTGMATGTCSTRSC